MYTKFPILGECAVKMEDTPQPDDSFASVSSIAL